MKLNPRDIRLWVALFFVIRLHGITNPPLETSHHWRQATVAMVARNLAEDNFDVFHPRMDTAGQLSGITGMEFPFLNLLIALFISTFGPAHWYGRLIVLIVSTIGMLSFHTLIRRRMNAQTALYSTLLLSVSLWFMYSRKIMPDVFSLSLVIVGLERLDFFAERARQYHVLLLGCVLVALGVLSKITAGCLLASLPVLLWRIRDRKGLVALILTSVLAACAPALWWYFKWVPYLVEQYGYWHFFMGKLMTEGLKELVSNLPRTLDNFYFDALRFSGFGVFLLGCYGIIQQKKLGLLALAALQGLTFLVVMLKAGNTFWMHAYYVLPIIPLMAVIGGYGLSILKNEKLAHVLLSCCILEGIASQWHDFRVNKGQAFLLELEADVADVVPISARIALNSADIPTPMYFTNRRGWTMTNELLAKPGTLDSLETLGCRYIIILRNSYEGTASVPWELVRNAEEYNIYASPKEKVILSKRK